MAKMTKKQLFKFNKDLGHAKECERAFSHMNELVRLSFQLGIEDLNTKILVCLDRFCSDIYEEIHAFLSVGEDEE